ncbi:hypothetical protein [Streptomyces sp. NPDC087437]|uniref:hypothetical protein n=1 Tax=Streptomyces sp. NPDC087437 TaxID=3365789 RepID=UPI00382C1B3C
MRGGEDGVHDPLIRAGLVAQIAQDQGKVEGRFGKQVTAVEEAVTVQGPTGSP